MKAEKRLMQSRLEAIEALFHHELAKNKFSFAAGYREGFLEGQQNGLKIAKKVAEIKTLPIIELIDFR